MKIDAKQIPDAVVEAAAREIFDRGEFLTLEDCRLVARASLAAALSAWPGATTRDRTVWKDGIDIDVPVDIILPLSKEGGQ